MKNQHLSEAEIQEYALGQIDRGHLEHIRTCKHCETKAANYSSIFSVMEELPKPAFNFDVATLVLQRLPRSKPVIARSDKWLYLLVFAAMGSISIPVYIYREYFLRMFNGILPVAMYLIVFVGAIVFLFQGIDLFRKYQKQMNALNYK